MALSPRMVAAMMQPETEDTDIALITITHPSWSEILRFSTHQTTWLYNDETSGEPVYGTVSRGETYLYIPLQATLPNSSDEEAPTGKIILCNVQRLVTPYLKMTSGTYPRLTLEIVNSATPDTVEKSYPELDLGDTNWNELTVEVQLKNNIASQEPCPWLRFSPAYFPNLNAR